MHSRRMRTARRGSLPGGSPPGTPPRTGPPPGTRHPLGQAPPQDQTPPWDQAPLRDQMPPLWDQAPPCGQTHTCKHITLPQTSFAGGNYHNNLTSKITTRTNVAFAFTFTQRERILISAIIRAKNLSS